MYGTRPEIIKLSPVIKLCQKQRIPFFCIHTGQHYSSNMNKIFFKELDLPLPEYRLNIKSKAPYRQGDHTGRMLIAMERILLRHMPDCVLVQGDTNTALVGTLVAEKISTTENYTGFRIKVAHVEAGLRSYDRTMPEEYNRFIADHLSDFLFVPTVLEKRILLREGVPASRIYVTGNTIVDVVRQNISAARENSFILQYLKLKKSSYILLTLHRQENVDSRKVFTNILKGLSGVNSKLKVPIIFPAHPRTIKMMKIFNLKTPAGIMIISPPGFLEFLHLEANATLVMTDSGGVQEEACILGVPCVTLRHNTERPQTVSIGANMIAGTQPRSIVQATAEMYRTAKKWKNPFGNGKTAQRILDALLA